MNYEFVHCHVHTEFSLLKSTVTIKDLIEYCTENNSPAIAMTDSGVMYGAIEFYKKAKDQKIKPLIGCELSLAVNGRFNKNSKEIFQIVLIAQNEKGYKNLTKLVSTAWIEGFYYEPRIDNEILSKHSEGLIMLSGSLDGEIYTNLIRGNYNRCIEVAKYYKDLFGDNFYIEIVDNCKDIQRRVNGNIYKLAKELNIKIVATNDIYYSKKEDALAREILNCIKDGRKIDKKINVENIEQYLKTPIEMYQIFHEIPEALKNSLEIAEKCSLIIQMGKSILPNYEVPPGHTVESYLYQIAKEGLNNRYKKIDDNIIQRFEYEMSIINKMGFSAYFLIVWDYINYARKNGIQVGPGRGSAAGSIVAYSLGITDIDPLPFNLLFERFLNPERISMPDVDTDFCIERRGEVIEYVTKKYGADKVSQIVTLGTLGAKQVIKDVSKTLGASVSEADRLSKMIPKDPNIKLKDLLKEGTDFYKEYLSNPVTKEYVDISLKLEGLSRHSGIHAAGVVISKEPLDTIVPLQKSSDGKLIAQYQMTDLEKVGLLKMDFLGLRNLTMIAKALEIIKQNKGLDLDINNIPLDDKKTYDLLSLGDTVGIFQLESSGMQKLVKDLQPNKFEEIIALIALYRPGPLGSGMVEEFVERKHGRREVKYPHPSLESVLKDTYGLIIYQEQIMQISQIIAGYTLGQADLLRKAMGKKLKEEMEKQKNIFIEGSIKNGINKELANDLFDTMEKFAEYGFNKSHSAAYAIITYRTAYLKANYPVEYMAALISSVMTNQDKVPLYINEARKMKIEIIPPDVIKSDLEFKVENDKIFFGLRAVKGVGENAIESIINARKLGKFKSLYDFCKRVDLSLINKRTIESLIKAGCFNSINSNKKQLLESMEEILSLAAKKQKEKLSGMSSLFGESNNIFDSDPPMKYCEDFSIEESLNLEKSVLGLYISGHPLEKYILQLERFSTCNISELKELNEGYNVTVGGIINSLKSLFTKKNDTMAVFNLEDLSGSVEVVVYPDIFNKYRDFIINEAKVLLSGKLQFKDEEPKITLSYIKNLSNIPYVELTLNEVLPMVKLISIRNIFQDFPGDTPVIIKFKDSDFEIICSRDYWVNPSDDFLNKINQLVDNNIRLVS